MKFMISLGVLIFSSLGGWLGTVLSHGNGFGIWAIVFTTIGGFVGIWLGFKAGKYFF